MSKQEFDQQNEDQETQDDVTDPNSEQFMAGQTDSSSEETELAFVAESSSAGHSAGIFMLAIIVIGGAIIYFMRMRGLPAARADSVEASTAKRTISEFLVDGDKNIGAMKTLLKSTERFIEQFNQMNYRKQVPIEQLKVNPFRFTEPHPEKPPEDPAKIIERELQKARAAATKQANDLKVQSIISGNIKSCMINNTMYTEGQEVEGFTIDQITPSSVIIRRDIEVGNKRESVKVPLKMKR